MRLLLDTHVVIWLYAGKAALGPAAVDELAAAEEVAVSVVSFAEIGIKTATRKLEMVDALEARLVADTVGILGLRPSHGLALADLPLHHRDPFDRMMIAQARSGDWSIMTADRAMAAYDVPLVDPRV